MRRALFWLLPILVLYLLVFPVLGQADVPAESIEQIDSIVLTVAPSFGLNDELTNNVASIRPGTGTVLIETIRQKDDAVQEQKFFRTQQDDVIALVSSLYEHDFFSMPEYLETDVMDGSFTWVTINMKNGESKRTGGLLAEEFGPDRFVAICEAISRVLQNSVEIPNLPADEHLSPGDEAKGAQLFSFCDAQDIADRIGVDPPSCASVCHYTVAGGTPYVVYEEAIVQHVADALSSMIVYEADGWGHTDDYLVYSLEWADRAVFTVTFQGSMLLGNKEELYPVMGFDTLVQALPPMIVPSI